MVGGQLAPDSGRVLLAGQDITGLAPRRIWRLGVGRTFQVAQTFVSMTVAENVQMALISRNGRTRAWWPDAAGLYRDEALGLLERVGCAANADRPCSELAYGDVKRVELAIALAGAPKLLLMDEPTAGMAPKERGPADAARRRHRPRARASACSSPSTTWTPCSRTPTTSSCWCAARSSPPAGRKTVRANARVREVYLGGGAGAAPACAGTRGEAAMRDDAILEVEGLDAAYGQAQILFDVSLEVARGEIVALMGRNGAGKSTTLKAIIGLVPAHARSAAVCRPRHPRAAQLSHRPARARLRAGGPAHLHRPHRRREPRGRRQGRRRGCTTARRGRPSGCSRSSPTSRRCAAGAPARCRAASSRCSPSPAR